MTCLICKSQEINSLIKNTIFYNHCTDCGCVYSKKPIPLNIITTENDASKERNSEDINQSRFNVVLNINQQIRSIIDFGCGEGQYVSLLDTMGYEVYGIDKNTDLKLNNFQNDRIDLINMTEVVEHLLTPHSIFKELHRILKVGGLIYIESSFTDFMDIQTSGYIDPRMGHCLVHSKLSLEILAEDCGFKIEKWVNNNVVILKKI